MKRSEVSTTNAPQLTHILDAEALVEADDSPRLERLAGAGELNTLEVPAAKLAVELAALVVGNSRRGKGTGVDGHHVVVHLQAPSLDLGEVVVVQGLAPALD